MRFVIKRLLQLVAVALGAFSLCMVSGVAPAAYSYPVSTCALLAVSTTVPNADASITVTGTGFLPGEHLTIMISSTPTALGTVTTSATGTFSKVVRIPASFTGSHDIYTVGGSESCPVDPVGIQVGGHDTGGSGTGGQATGGQSAGHSGTNSGGLPFTGFDSILFLLIALAAVGAGLLFVRAGRQNRRRRNRRYYLGGQPQL